MFFQGKMPIFSGIESSSDVENRLEFDQNIGHDTFETIAETILRQLNELNTSKCVQESSNSTVVQDTFTDTNRYF